MSLPWDQFQPEDDTPQQPVVEPPAKPEPVAPQPVTPTENLPSKQGTIDLAAIMREAFAQAIRESAPQLRDAAGDFAHETIDAVRTGQDIDWEHPTITATTERGKELVVADARSRSGRTFLQGLGIDLTFALVAVLTTLAGVDPLSKDTWILFGALLIKTVIQTVVSYVMRLRITPTIRTPGERVEIMPVPKPTPAEQ